MKRQALLLASGSVVAACCLAACSPFSGNSWQTDLQAAAEAANKSVAADDAYYQSAVTAIASKDYALALDYLQAAKASDPKDVRVLNALGVVYDKLGRFDLSARYYAQAHGLDPQSPIVANNLRYSQVLQSMMAGHPAPQVAALERQDSVTAAPVFRNQSTSPDWFSHDLASASAQEKEIRAASSAGSTTPTADADALLAAIRVAPAVAVPAELSFEPHPAFATAVSASPDIGIAQAEAPQVAAASVLPFEARSVSQNALVVPEFRVPENRRIETADVLSSGSHILAYAPAVPAFPAAEERQIVTADVLAFDSRAVPQYAPAVPTFAAPEERQIATANVLAFDVRAVPQNVPAVPQFRAAEADDRQVVTADVLAFEPVPHDAPAVPDFSTPQAKQHQIVTAEVFAFEPHAVPQNALIAPQFNIDQENQAAVEKPSTLVGRVGVILARLLGNLVSDHEPADRLATRSLSPAQAPASTVGAPAEIRSPAVARLVVPDLPAAFLAEAAVMPAVLDRHNKVANLPPISQRAVATLVRSPSLRLTPSTVFLTGHPLDVVNASGQTQATNSIRRALSELNWTISRDDLQVTPAQAQTIVSYPRANVVVAQGLARTVPFPVRLEVNTCNCGAVQLIIGADYLNWSAARTSTADAWKAAFRVARVEMAWPGVR